MHEKPKEGMCRRLLPRRQLKAMHDEFDVNDETVWGVHV